MLAFSVDRCHWYPCLCSSLFIKAAWYCLVFSEQSSTGHTKSVTYLGKYGGSWNHGSWRWVVFQKDVGCLDDGICHSRQKFASLLNYFISQIWTLFRTPENPMESHTNTIMSIPVHLSFAYHAFQPPAKIPSRFHSPRDYNEIIRPNLIDHYHITLRLVCIQMVCDYGARFISNSITHSVSQWT